MADPIVIDPEQFEAGAVYCDIINALRERVKVKKEEFAALTPRQRKALVRETMGELKLNVRILELLA